jgi:hypothetical protein
VISVGGGKPLGFGSVSIDIEPMLVQTAQVRYLGADRHEADPRRQLTPVKWVSRMRNIARIGIPDTAVASPYRDMSE